MIERSQEALGFLERSIDLLREPGTDSSQLGRTLHSIGFAHGNLGDHRKALEFYEAALQEERKAPLPDQEIVGRSLHGIGYSHMKLGDQTKALEFLEQALQEKRKEPFPNKGSMGKTLIVMGDSQDNLGNPDKALRALEEAERLCREAGDAKAVSRAREMSESIRARVKL
jgi:tetratricopeptide (TPR) repeat protein